MRGLAGHPALRDDPSGSPGRGDAAVFVVVQWTARCRLLHRDAHPHDASRDVSTAPLFVWLGSQWSSGPVVNFIGHRGLPKYVHFFSFHRTKKFAMHAAFVTKDDAGGRVTGQYAIVRDLSLSTFSRYVLLPLLLVFAPVHHLHS